MKPLDFSVKWGDGIKRFNEEWGHRLPHSPTKTPPARWWFVASLNRNGIARGATTPLVRAYNCTLKRKSSKTNRLLDVTWWVAFLTSCARSVLLLLFFFFSVRGVPTSRCARRLEVATVRLIEVSTGRTLLFFTWWDGWWGLFSPIFGCGVSDKFRSWLESGLFRDIIERVLGF